MIQITTKPTLENFTSLLEPIYNQVNNLDFYRNSPMPGTIVWAFQHTSSFADAVADVNFFPKSVPWFDTKVTVHKGVWSQYINIRDIILNDIYSYNNIYTYGYSLGASLSQLAHSDCIWHKKRDNLSTSIISIGYYPLKVFSKNMDPNLFVGYTHVNNILDIVGYLPPIVYKHFGESIRIPTVIDKPSDIWRQHCSDVVKRSLIKYDQK